MKKVIKNNLFGFILGAILFGGIGTVVATTILSSTVSYTNNNRTTVETALNELYSKAARLDGWIDPRGLNTDGNGGKISFVYWNDDFSNTTYTSTQVPTGTGLNGIYQTREQLATAYSNWSNAQIYIKTTKVNGTVTGHTSCLWYNNREFCVAPNYWDTDSATTKTKIKADMENALGITIADSSCGSITSYAGCSAGDFSCGAYSYGDVRCFSRVSDESCYVYGLSNANCTTY